MGEETDFPGVSVTANYNRKLLVFHFDINPCIWKYANFANPCSEKVYKSYFITQ